MLAALALSWMLPGSAVEPVPQPAAESAAEPVVDASPHAIHGTWGIQTPAPELRKRLDAAVDDVASEFNLMVREVARRKIAGATKVCDQYDLAVEPASVRVVCDDGPVHVLPADGKVYRTTNAAGEPVQGVVTVEADALVLTWSGPAGKRVNRFARKGDALTLAVTVSSTHMPRPLRWTVDYGRRPAAP